jgi:modification methylase
MTDPRPRAPRPGHASQRPDRDPRAPLSVWVTAQRDARTQRRGRYLPAATAHPAKMLPAIAATAITRYSEPGDLVADPMCGIGTTLVEAIHLGRDAVGVEYEPRWAHIAAANITHARGQGAPGEAEVIRGDARQLPALLAPGIAGRVALVVTSPPYGRSVHGQVRAEQRTGGGGVQKYDNRYSDDPANLACHGLDDLLAGFTQILTGCKTLLRPGGTVVVTARPWRQRGELVDLPGAVIAAGASTGLIPAERCVALRGQWLIPRPSFFQLDNIRKARARGEPWHLIVHEDVLVFRAPGNSLEFPRTQGSAERNSRDVVLKPLSSAGLREVQPGPGSPPRQAPAVPGTRAA